MSICSVVQRVDNEVINIVDAPWQRQETARSALFGN